MLTAGVSVAAGAGVGALLIYVFARGGRRSGWLDLRAAGPAWTGPAVLGAFVLFLLFGVGAARVESVLVAGGFFQSVYGPNFPIDLPADPTPAQKAAATVRYLWAHALAFPVLMAALIVLPRVLKLADPFRGRGWPGAVVAGYLTWLMITPAAFCVFVVASIIHMKLTGRAPEKHPLTALGEVAGRREWGLFVLQTVVIAPILEEWLFRGVLLPWLVQKRPVQPESPFAVPLAARPLLVLGVAIAVAVALTLGTDWLARPDEVRRTLADPAAVAASYIIPAGFFLAIVPLDYLLPRWSWLRRRLRLRSRQQVRAILASSALFAAFHAPVWPSPIALLVLAIGLGYLYLRTRNLMAPIVVHGLFNAVSAVCLLLGGLA